MASISRIQILTGTAAVTTLAAAWLFAVGEGPSTLPNQTTANTAERSIAPAPAPVEPQTTPVDLEITRGLAFTDISEESGIAAPQALMEPTDALTMTGGGGVADYDADGDLDVYLTRLGMPNRLLRNDGHGSFTDVTDVSGTGGTPAPSGGSAAPVWADIEGDGDLDLLVTGVGTSGTSLYVNDGEGVFTDQAAARGIPAQLSDETGGRDEEFGAAFNDIDHDDDLDLVILQWYSLALGMQDSATGTIAGLDPTRANDEGPGLCEASAVRGEPRATGGVFSDQRSGSRLWLNDGNGHFVDGSSASGVDFDRIVGFQPVFGDVTGDQWDDLLITGDFCTSRLYRNDRDGSFTDITGEARVGSDENGMGSVVDDLNGDGHLDWFVTGIRYPTAEGGCPIVAPSIGCSGNRLYLGDGAGRFTDATDRLGVRDAIWGWGATAADLNSDGHRDLLAVNGYRDRPRDNVAEADEPNLALYQHMDGDPTRLWLGQETEPWPEVAEQVGIDDRVNSKAVVAFDVDGDGDLDLLLANTNADPILYRNDLPAGPSTRWLTLRLSDPTTTNRFAIGARVVVTLGDGSLAQTAQVRSGGSFQSSEPPDLHFGLGSAPKVDRLEIYWPGRAEPQVLIDVAADQVLDIARG